MKIPYVSFVFCWSDGQGLWSINVWEANVCDEGPNIEPLASFKGWKESTSIGTNAKCVCGKVNVITVNLVYLHQPLNSGQEVILGLQKSSEILVTHSHRGFSWRLLSSHGANPGCMWTFIGRRSYQTCSFIVLHGISFNESIVKFHSFFILIL